MQEISLEERKKIVIGILERIHSFCLDNGIKYYLAYGSLIGAIRHSGFIPWDDDIDLWMFRKDYEHFIKLFSEINDPIYKISSIHNDTKYNLAFAKVYDSRTYISDGAYKAPDLGINVDIFPLDLLSDDINQAKKLLKKIKKYKVLSKLQSARIKKERAIYENLAILIGRIIPRFLIIRKIDKLSQKYDIFSGSRFCGNLTTLPYGEREILKKEWFSSITEVAFEGKRFFAPQCYDDILTNIYGDYMKLPPIEKRIQHANVAFWR